MFESIVLRRATGGQPISAGYIAEALLYYRKLHIVIDRGTLLHLVKQLGIGGVMTVLSRSNVSAVYCEQTLGTRTDSVGVSHCHNFVAFTFSGTQRDGEIKTPRERIQFDLERQGISKTIAKKFARVFLDRVPLRKFSGNHFIEGGIPSAAKRDLLDIEFAKQAIREAIKVTCGGYEVGNELKLEVIESDLGCYVFSNLNLEVINKNRVASVKPVEPANIQNFLTNILEARADLALSSFYGGDFITSDVNSSIIQVRHSEFLKRKNINAASKQQFSEIVLPDSPSLAEVIDAGERSFDDFLHLLDRAGRFKEWLNNVSPDEGLVRSYMQDVSSEGWIQQLPAKSLRYVLTAALDATNPVVGLIASVVDNFLVEKLFEGWRPNHFVSRRLTPFIRGN